MGPYNLGRRLGKGAFGTVYECRHSSGTIHALKRVPKSKLSSFRAVDRLCVQLSVLQEPDLAVQHPNILYFKQVLQSSSDIYLVMPSMATDVYEMTSKLKTSGGIAEDHILDMIRPIMDALACLHERGIAHRDVKSENILVDYTPNCDDPQRPTVNRICLIDFDMCCNVASANDAEGLGSLGFMAPEALIKHVPDPTKLDVWSIACVLLELVMGPEWFGQNWLRAYRQYREATMMSSDKSWLADLPQKLESAMNSAMDVMQHNETRDTILGCLQLSPDVRFTARAAIIATRHETDAPVIPVHTTRTLLNRPAEDSSVALESSIFTGQQEMINANRDCGSSTPERCKSLSPIASPKLPTLHKVPVRPAERPRRQRSFLMSGQGPKGKEK